MNMFKSILTIITDSFLYMNGTCDFKIERKNVNLICTFSFNVIYFILSFAFFHPYLRMSLFIPHLHVFSIAKTKTQIFTLTGHVLSLNIIKYPRSKQCQREIAPYNKNNKTNFRSDTKTVITLKSSKLILIGIYSHVVVIGLTLR